jgi:hypothetical protein
MMDLLEELFAFRRHRWLRLDGSTPIAERRDLVDAWQVGLGECDRGCVCAGMYKWMDGWMDGCATTCKFVWVPQRMTMYVCVCYDNAGVCHMCGGGGCM